MLPDRSSKVGAAIRACLEECYGSDSVLTRIALFLGRLRSRPEWREHELRSVELGVHRMLQALAGGEGDPAPLPAAWTRRPESGRRARRDTRRTQRV